MRLSQVEAAKSSLISAQHEQLPHLTEMAVDATADVVNAEQQIAVLKEAGLEMTVCRESKSASHPSDT